MMHMSPARWMTSLLLMCHVLALALASVPSPDLVTPVGPPRHPSAGFLVSTLTPLLDRTAATLATVSGHIWSATRPLHRVATLYVNSSGLEGHWSMFAVPGETDQYIRIRYWVSTTADARNGELGELRVATELVFPIHREDRPRLMRSYWNKFQDKSIAEALSRFYRSAQHGQLRAGPPQPELPDDLAPVLRFFARRFERDHLDEGERILRAELWAGRSPNPKPGATRTVEEIDAHLAVLRRYYDGPIERRASVPSYPQHHASELEGDIEWVLEYFEAP
jgi:hypothetical protein